MWRWHLVRPQSPKGWNHFAPHMLLHTMHWQATRRLTPCLPAAHPFPPTAMKLATHVSKTVDRANHVALCALASSHTRLH